jgi:LacI family transcriptional regulator
VSVKRFEFNRYVRASFAKAMASFDPMQFAGLLIAPVIPDETTALLSRLPANYPVVFFDAQIPTFKPLTRIGQNAYQSGLLAGRLLEAFSSRSGPYVIVGTHSEDYHIRRRIEGFRAYFEGRGYEVHLRECFDIEHREKREHFTCLLLQEFSSIDGVFVTNASVHGIAADLNRRPGQKHITVVGYDLVPENIRQIEASTIDCIILNDRNSRAIRASTSCTGRSCSASPLSLRSRCLSIFTSGKICRQSPMARRKRPRSTFLNTVNPASVRRLETIKKD